MADEADSKSVVGNNVRVQVPLPAVKRKKEIRNRISFFLFRILWQIPIFSLFCHGTFPHQTP